ncbi:hypothetical protein L227DRAFT_571242 [Lentinus tigrinus ALCF2SS1-6]|uniref:Uncharacterized protein n=1 Tax=Lentinus tigrinus ALCF2SS1-6 TaxID=1328759 RepID=A0A5C2SM00_9APHY|nr:hypothetical protein L227DRAFT_571242 [Lentinus tigrinus ALCF2SS1-6]
MQVNDQIEPRNSSSPGLDSQWPPLPTGGYRKSPIPTGKESVLGSHWLCSGWQRSDISMQPSAGISLAPRRRHPSDIFLSSD